MKSTKLYFIFAFCLVTTLCFGQSIKGRINDANTGEPIPFANVFFSGTLIGTTSDIDGNFSLDFHAEGRFDLIVSFVGYLEFVKTISSSDSEFLEIKLKPEVIQLNDVYVNADTTGWERNYQSFKGLFLGETKNASKTAIRNPRDIFLYYDRVDRGLFAHSRKEITIENESLGYRLIYLMKDFQMLYSTGEFRSFGIPRFEEMETKKKGRMKKWNKERVRAYNGSFAHFLNSLQENTFYAEGFRVFELHKVPNKKRPPQELIDEKLSDLRKELRVGNATISIGEQSTRRDSIRYWGRMNRMPKIIDSLGIEHKENDVLIKDGSFDYSGYLRIQYLNESEEEAYAFTRPGGGIDTKQTSDILVSGPMKIYPNGYYDVGKVLFMGYFAWSQKIAEMLPLDYAP